MGKNRLIANEPVMSSITRYSLAYNKNNHSDINKPVCLFAVAKYAWTEICSYIYKSMEC